MKFGALVLILLLGFGVVSAQTSTPEPRLIVPREQAIIRSGPGHTFSQIDRLRWPDEITIIERNEVGNWVNIRVPRGDKAVIGWVPTGYLALDESILLSKVPVDDSVEDADPSTVDSKSLARLYAVPVLSDISDAMLEVYEQGSKKPVITKIGDSLSASRVFLTAISRENPELGPYDFLLETIEYYGPSLATPSVASKIGLSSIAVFDPTWADPALCQPNETPLACEYRIKQPSIAFILFGPNDVLSMTTERYTEQMTKIVEQTLEHNIIPVLMTFSADPEGENWWQTVNFNLALADIAAEYEVPLINLWAAERPLPEYGLDQDHIHLKHSGFENVYFKNGHEAYYGVTLQNLLAINMLDKIRKAL